MRAAIDGTIDGIWQLNGWSGSDNGVRGFGAIFRIE